MSTLSWLIDCTGESERICVRQPREHVDDAAAETYQMVFPIIRTWLRREDARFY